MTGAGERRTIVLYDEACVVCRAGVAWVRFFDRAGATECWPVQGTDLAALHPELDPTVCLRDLHLVTADGEVLTNWPAVRHLLGVLPAFRPVARLAATRPGGRLGERITRACPSWWAAPCHASSVTSPPTPDQVARGRADGLSDRAIEATCFPWGAAWSLESKGTDEIARLLTGGRFSRTQVVRSFPAVAAP